MGVNNYIDLSFYLKKLGNHEQSIDARVWDEGSDENAILHDQELLRGLRAELPRWPTFLQREAVPSELRHERDRQLLDYVPTPAEHDEQRRHGRRSPVLRNTPKPETKYNLELELRGRRWPLFILLRIHRTLSLTPLSISSCGSCVVPLTLTADPLFVF